MRGTACHRGAEAEHRYVWQAKSWATRRAQLWATLCTILCLSFGLSTNTLAQYYSTGADPLHMHWHTIGGEKDGEGNETWHIMADTLALRWASEADRVLRTQAPLLIQDFGSLRVRKVPIVVHSRSAYSNGMVTWAPRRMELYPWDTGQDDCVPWPTHLLTHEWRHVLQTQSSMVGFSRFLNVLFGQQAAGPILGLFYPSWALEGDAVWAETQYTSGGRGERAWFMQQMRTLELYGRRPSYSQAYFGSYAMRVPDYYHLGYLMVSAVSDSLGNKVWANALQYIGRHPFTIFPFATTMRKQTGMRPFALYQWAMNRWANQCTNGSDTLGHKPTYDPAPNQPQATHRLLWPQQMTPRHNHHDQFANVTHPKAWRGGTLAYVGSPETLSHFAWCDSLTGQTHWLITPSARNETMFTLQTNTMVWSERRQHIRWSNASENRLMAAELTMSQKGKIKTRKWVVSRDRNLHSPSLSPSGNQLAAVEVEADMRHAIVTTPWNSPSKKPRQRVWSTVLTVPTGWQVAEVTYQNDSTLLAIVVSPKGKSIAKIELEPNNETQTEATKREPKATEILGPVNLNISSITSDTAGNILFSVDPNAHSDIYRLSPNGTVQRLTYSQYGADHPHPTPNGLMLSNYGNMGYRPVMLPTNNITANSTSDQMVGQEQTQRADAHPLNLPTEPSTAPHYHTPWPRIHMLPNVHSWGPIVVDADEQTLTPGISIASQNAHGTVMMQAGVNFGDSQSDERLFASATWDWFWTRLKIKATWGKTHYKLHTKEMVEMVDNSDPRRPNLTEIYMLENQMDDYRRPRCIEASATVPLTFLRGAWQHGVTPGYSIDWQKANGLTTQSTLTLVESATHPHLRGQSTTKEVTGAEMCYSRQTVGLNAYALRRMADRDLGCRWGINLNLWYDMAKVPNNYGTMLTTSVRTYWPGIGRHHQLVLSGSYQTKRPGEVMASSDTTYVRRLLGDRVNAPYGLSRVTNKWSALVRAQYNMPLVDPDWQWGPVAYIKRVSMGLVGDWSRAQVWNGFEGTQIVNRWTCSMELWADTRIALLPYAVTIGGRASWGPDIDGIHGALLLSIAFK